MLRAFRFNFLVSASFRFLRLNNEPETKGTGVRIATSPVASLVVRVWLRVGLADRPVTILEAPVAGSEIFQQKQPSGSKRGFLE